MSHTTADRPSVQAVPRTQTPSTVTVPEGFQAVAAKLLPWWAEATPEQQQLVLEDMALAHQADGLSPEDYCADPMPLAEHMATVLEERQRRGLPLPQTQPLEPSAEPRAEPKPPEQQQRADVDARAQKRVESQAKDIAERWQKYDVRQTTGLVDLGKRCEEYIRTALAAGYRRKNATDLLEQQILLATGETKDVNRAVQLYWACKLYGESFARLAITGQKALAAFIVRDAATEDWAFKPDFADEARKLYDRACNERMTGDAIRAEANRIKDGNSTGTRAEKAPEPEAETETDADTSDTQADTKGGTSKTDSSKPTPKDTRLALMQIAHGPANDIAGTIVLLLSHAKDPKAVLHTLGATLKWEDGFASSLVEGMATNPQGNAALTAMLELVETVEEETGAESEAPVAAVA